MNCSNPDCSRGIGLIRYRRGWLCKRPYCSRQCRDAFVAHAPKPSPQDRTATICFGSRRICSTGSLLFLMLAAFLWATIAFAQDYQGTNDQRMSCTPDAFRLCATYIPDPGKVENCLRRNFSSLSDACRSVFNQGIRSRVSVNK
jgi:hypothetical protein